MKKNLHRTARALCAWVLAAVMVLTTLACSVFAAGPGKVYSGEPKHYLLFPDENLASVNENTKITTYKGDDKVDTFLEEGGAGSISDLVLFLAKHFAVPTNLNLKLPSFGCSSIQVSNGNGGYLFGRNFDYSPCTSLILYNEPTDGYKSISTTDLNLVTDSVGSLANLIPDYIMKAIALWIPVDGMNEKGLTMSINMIDDKDAVISQNNGHPKQICATAVRTILDKCATVDEALNLLRNSDFHTWDNFMVHMAITDATGKHVVVEYIDNQLSVIDSPINTNFYLTPGKKYGIGTHQSVIRYNTLTKTLKEHPVMDQTFLRDTMHSVAKSNFPDDEHTTEWSVIYDQANLTGTWYRQENYKVAYTVNLK